LNFNVAITEMNPPIPLGAGCGDPRSTLWEPLLWSVSRLCREFSWQPYSPCSAGFLFNKRKLFKVFPSQRWSNVTASPLAPVCGFTLSLTSAERAGVAKR